MNDEDVRKFETEQDQIRKNYKAMEGPGLDHFLDWMETERLSLRKSADNERDNLAKAGDLLHSSNVYEKVKSHLANMLGE